MKTLMLANNQRYAATPGGKKGCGASERNKEAASAAKMNGALCMTSEAKDFATSVAFAMLEIIAGSFIGGRAL